MLSLPLGIAVSLVLTPLARRVAIRYSILDVPDGTRYNRAAIPLLGGVAVTASILFAWLITHAISGLFVTSAELLILAGFALSFVLGMYDDRNGMQARWKLLSQFVCGAFLAGGCYAGNLAGPWFLLPVLLLWVVGIMNAINFLDNMDGIAGGVSGIASLAFAGLLAMHGQWVGLVIAGATCGASVGFLTYNFPPARIFLGDAGSLPLGYLLSALSILAAGSSGGHAIVAPFVVLGYPVFDIAFVTIVRMRERRRFYEGGKDHSSHRLASLLRSPRKTALTIYALCLGLAMLAFAVERTGGLLVSISVPAALLLCFVFFGARLSRVKTGRSSS